MADLFRIIGMETALSRVAEFRLIEVAPEFAAPGKDRQCRMADRVSAEDVGSGSGPLCKLYRPGFPAVGLVDWGS